MHPNAFEERSGVRIEAMITAHTDLVVYSCVPQTNPIGLVFLSSMSVYTGGFVKNDL